MISEPKKGGKNAPRPGRPLTSESPLADAMRKRGVTRAELSEATGVSISAIARWLAGRGRPPRVDVAARIATILKTTPEKLFTPSVATRAG